MKPDSWDDELEKSRVILFDENTRIRIRIALRFDSLNEILTHQEFSRIRIKTSGTKSGGADYALTASNCSFVNATDYSEIRVELTRQQLIDLHCLPENDEDLVNEKAWYDPGSDGPGDHNLSDGYAFDDGTSDLEPRGRCIVDGDFEDEPPTSPLGKNDISFLQTAGAELLIAQFAAVSSETRQIANQADIFYYSGHGDHHSALLYTDIQKTRSFSASQARWNRELKIAVLAGCSVLDIKNYRLKSFGPSTRVKLLWRGGATSPGEAWENIGPKFLVGYCWVAPKDTQGTAAIISTFLANVRGGMSIPQAWGTANDAGSNPYASNACVIDCSNPSQHEFWFWDETSGTPTWTRVTKGNVWPTHN